MKLVSVLIITLVAMSVTGAQANQLSRVVPPATPDAGGGVHGHFKAVVDSFPSPGASPMGVDWVESHGVLYHVNEWLDTNVYAIDPDDGSATLLFDISAAVGAPTDANGLAYVEERQSEYLYTTDWLGQGSNDDAVYKFTTAGAFIDSFRVYWFCPGAAGICYDGTYFWLSCTSSGQIVKCNAAFEPLAFYAHPSGSGGGMDYDPVTGHYYVMDVWNAHIYVCDGDMVVLDDFPAGWLGGSANGLCVGRDRGRTLFFSNFSLGRIYEIDDEFVSPVESASWGTVKGMYR